MTVFQRFSPGRMLLGAALVVLPALHMHAQEGMNDPIFGRYRSVSSAIGKASDQVEAHHFKDAQKTLAPVLNIIPDHAGAHFLLARMAYESRDFAGALSHIETSEKALVDLNQRYIKVMDNMKARDEVDARETEDSLASLVGAGYDSIGDILHDKQHHLNDLEARKRGLFSRDASFAVPSVYHLLHGNCLYRLGRAKEAAVQYQLAIHSEPANARAWNNLINLYWEGKDFDQAKLALAKAEAAGVTIQPKLKQSVLEAK